MFDMCNLVGNHKLVVDRHIHMGIHIHMMSTDLMDKLVDFD